MAVLYVGPASHSFVRRKKNVEQAIMEDNELTMEIQQLEEYVALSETITREELKNLCIKYTRFAEYPRLTCKRKRTL